MVSWGSLAIPFPEFPGYLCASILLGNRRKRGKSLRKTGKCLPSEKKIANPLFYRYIIPAFLSNTIYQRAGVRVVEWARLESVCTGNSTEGSNPSLSAINFLPQCICNEYIAVFVHREMGKKWGKIGINPKNLTTKLKGTIFLSATNCLDNWDNLSHI